MLIVGTEGEPFHKVAAVQLILGPLPGKGKAGKGGQCHCKSWHKTTTEGQGQVDGNLNKEQCSNYGGPRPILQPDNATVACLASTSMPNNPHL